MPGETILVIDDSPTIRKVVSANLRKAGYRVEVAGDGQEGLELAKELSPRLILLDFVMPRMNGFQFCLAMRKVQGLARVPVVLMSAKGDKIGAKFIQQMGAVDSITKPFSPEALLAVSGHVLAKYSSMAADEPTRKYGPMEDFIKQEFESVDESLEDGEVDTARQWSIAENVQAREVAEQIAGRVADILTTALPDLTSRGDEIEDALARRLTPKALETISHAIAQLEPAAGQAAFAGDLAAVPLPEVLQLLQLQKQTGCFEISRDRFKVLVHFSDGKINLAQAREGRAEFLLGRYMVEDEVIGRTELELLLKQRDESQTLLGQILLQRGYLAQADLARVLERQSCELMYEALLWRRGRYAFRPGVVSREADLAQLGLSAESILMEGFRRVDEWLLIEEKIEDFDVVFVRDDLAVERFGLDKLTHEERTVLDAVDGRRALREIVELTHMGSFLVSKLLYRLLSVQLIRKRA
jgi:DNA-binding response OmpR family regulator